MSTEKEAKLLKQAVTEPLEDEDVKDVAGGLGLKPREFDVECKDCSYRRFDTNAHVCGRCGSTNVTVHYSKSK